MAARQPPADWIVPAWPAPRGVRALCTTRAGGVSLPPYDRFNLGVHVGDVQADVTLNRARLRDVLGVRPVFLDQVHGVEAILLDEATPDGTRADAATVGLWVETLSGIISMVGTGVPLLKSLFGALGRNGAKTATIELPNGVKVTREMDDEELERLVRASSGG